jgi:hypothetical protein
VCDTDPHHEGPVTATKTSLRTIESASRSGHASHRVCIADLPDGTRSRGSQRQSRHLYSSRLRSAGTVGSHLAVVYLALAFSGGTAPLRTLPTFLPLCGLLQAVVKDPRWCASPPLFQCGLGSGTDPGSGADWVGTDLVGHPQCRLHDVVRPQLPAPLSARSPGVNRPVTAYGDEARTEPNRVNGAF